MSNEDTTRQLKQIKIWIALGAIGFVLIGASFLTLAVSWAYMVTEYEDAFEEGLSNSETGEFSNQASALFESGNLDDLQSLIDQREVSHPYDSDIFWYRAKLHAIHGEWDQALDALDEAGFLAPSWESEYVAPMRAAINRKRFTEGSAQ